MGLSGQENWCQLPFPSLGDLFNPGIESRSFALQADSLPSEPPGKSSHELITSQRPHCFFVFFFTMPCRTNTPPKKCPFHYRGMECISRKSRNTWSNRQIWPWSTEWSRAKANKFLLRECTGHSKHPLPITQEKTTHGHHKMVNTDIRLIDYMLWSQRWRSST